MRPSELHAAFFGLAFTIALIGAPDAWAQSNSVFLGQVGNTNSITIDQTGAGNLVGGDTQDLRLNQLGDGNTITIRQIGENNGIGRANRIGRPGFLTGRLGMATGLFQRGDGNVFSAVQETFRGAGSNLLGALAQTAASGIRATTNRAEIRQIGGTSTLGTGASTGPGFHQIGEIAQRHLADTGTSAANEMSVSQTGLRQTAEQLHQLGAANTIVLEQTGAENTLRLASQEGLRNRAGLRQNGTANTLGNARQIGDDNWVTLRMDGSSNFVDQIVQAGRGGSGEGRGNSARISIAGDDNGGEGIGGYRAMSGYGSTLSAFAASLEQYGDDNALTLTIGSGEAGRADGNAFSIGQAGLGNQASALVTGDENRLALRQDGDGNLLDIVQSSTTGRSVLLAARGNEAAIEEIGHANRLAVDQSGTGHRLTVRIEGDRNTSMRLSSGSPLQQMGGIVQRGEGQSAFAFVTGHLDRVSITQAGRANSAEVAIKGNANTAVLQQSGRQNIARSIQFGDNNYTLIRQE